MNVGPVAIPDGEVTETAPLVAPVGTEVVIVVALDAVTVATVP